ncbi:MAG: nucleotide exchange factor GrpE [Bacteroidota bacterium]
MPTDPTPPHDGATGDDVRDEIRPQMSNEDAADVAVGAVDELAEQAVEIERLRAENADLHDQLLRRAAEFQNFRRRQEQQRALNEGYARDALLAPFLDVYDDLRRSLDAAQRQAKQEDEATPAFEALAEGVNLVFKKFSATLDRLGVERIEAVGQPFSEELHEAMMQQPAPDDDTAPGTVLAELQPGYRIGDRILRHARVIVAQ